MQEEQWIPWSLKGGKLVTNSVVDGVVGVTLKAWSKTKPTITTTLQIP